MARHSAKQLGLHRQSLPHSIVEVINTLTKAGFSAYIVGGGVRDSLLGLAPKDFDAVTDARPHEIKELFGGRCRIIGKRFQLAHVYSGREMIEVATFRAPPKDDNHTTDEGMIVRDNVWGNINQDFARRDFSVNALYYEPIKGEVQDFCGALDDIATKTLRLLGKPALRIEEDPVRLLRALRFCAKLGFEFDKSLAKQFHKDNWALLEQVSPHRLYDETQKMFCGGYLTALLPLLYRYGAMDNLVYKADDKPSDLMMYVAQNTDERIKNGLGANPAFFYATLLWGNYLHNLTKFKKKLPLYEAQTKAAARTIERQRYRTAIPKFAEEFISQIWILQTKLTTLKPKDIETLIKHPKFRPAYDFLLAREAADTHPLSEPIAGMGAWWTQFQLFDDKARKRMIDELSSGRRSRRKKEAVNQNVAEFEQIRQLSLSDDTTAQRARPLFETAVSPPKRRRVAPVLPIDTPSYSEEDFAKLLLDEPFIPAKRRHKKPSSTLSIKERLASDQQTLAGKSDGVSEDVKPASKKRPPKEVGITSKQKTSPSAKASAKAPNSTRKHRPPSSMVSIKERQAMEQTKTKALARRRAQKSKQPT